MVFGNDKNVDESFDELTTIHLHQKKTIKRHTNIFTFISPEKKYSSHRHQYSIDTKKKLKKTTIIDASHPLPLEPPFTAPTIKRYQHHYRCFFPSFR